MSKHKRKGSGSPFEKLKELKQKLAQEEAEQKQLAEKPKPVEKKSSLATSSPDEEALAFVRMMSGVRPLEPTSKTRLPKLQSPLERSELAKQVHEKRGSQHETDREIDEVHEHLRRLVEGAVRFEVVDDGQHVEGKRVDLPDSVLRKLRRGLWPIDAQLDLHGLSAEEAKAQLGLFLKEKRERREQMVLIIHGKGEHSPGGLGVLRGEMTAWLSQGAPSEHVAAFCTARESDGGAGATYVLLRK